MPDWKGEQRTPWASAENVAELSDSLHFVEVVKLYLDAKFSSNPCICALQPFSWASTAVALELSFGPVVAVLAAHLVFHFTTVPILVCGQHIVLSTPTVLVIRKGKCATR